MRYRIIQWATGGVGRAAIEGIVKHPELELVGCWVHGRKKAGRDAGEIAGIAPIGVVRLSEIRRRVGEALSLPQGEPAVVELSREPPVTADGPVLRLKLGRDAFDLGLISGSGGRDERVHSGAASRLVE